jgi:hypothetical protein
MAKAIAFRRSEAMWCWWSLTQHVAAKSKSPTPLFFAQSFLRLGDLMPASAMLALVTGVLPLAMLGVLQWSIMLAFWGLMPLRLWV